MRFSAILLFALPLLTFAQNPPAPPPEVDQALRERATAFLKFQSEGKFGKAFEFVADDSKDYYLGAPKTKVTSVEIQKIEYSDNFTKALVTSPSTQTQLIATIRVEIPSGTIDRWRLEDGQWKWYHDASQDVEMTLLGPLPAAAQGTPGATAPLQLPKDLTPKAVKEAVTKLAVPTATINHKAVAFVVGREATREIVYHNNGVGEVRVEADLISAPGFKVEPAKFTLGPQAEAIFKVTYYPSETGISDSNKIVSAGTLRLTVQPFEAEYRLPIWLGPDPKASKP